MNSFSMVGAPDPLPSCNSYCFATDQCLKPVYSTGLVGAPGLLTREGFVTGKKKALKGS